MAEFHKIWIDQCAATHGIKEQFGVKDATRYLIGEKFVRFLEASFDHPEFAAEIPAFVSEIKSIFLPSEIDGFFEDFKKGEVISPGEAVNALSRELHGDEDEGLNECDVVRDAEKLLLAENARRLLLGE